MSDKQVFLPIVNENQYNLLISLATAFLRENLANLANLVRDGMANPPETDSDLAVVTVNELALLKSLIATLTDKRQQLKPTWLDSWPIRIALPSETLLIVRNRILTIQSRLAKLSASDQPTPTIQWWSIAAGVHPNDYDNLMVLIGSLEAIKAQVPNKFSGMTIMTGSD